MSCVLKENLTSKKGNIPITSEDFNGQCSFDCRVCMYVFMWVSGFLYMCHTLSRVTLHLWDRARSFCFQYHGTEWKTHLFSSFFSYFSTAHSVVLSHPPILSPVLSTLYLSLPLTCLTDIDVHRIWQMWHFYQSPLNAFTSLTEALSEQTTLHASDSLAIHMSTLWNITYGQSGISFSIKPRSHWQQWSLFIFRDICRFLVIYMRWCDVDVSSELLTYFSQLQWLFIS